MWCPLRDQGPHRGCSRSGLLEHWPRDALAFNRVAPLMRQLLLKREAELAGGGCQPLGPGTGICEARATQMR